MSGEEPTKGNVTPMRRKPMGIGGLPQEDQEALELVKDLTTRPEEKIPVKVIELVNECKDQAATNADLMNQIEMKEHELQGLRDAVTGNSVAVVKLGKIIYKMMKPKEGG